MTGSLNVGLGGQYATWAGSVIDPKRPVVLICEPGTELEYIRQNQTCRKEPGRVRAEDDSPKRS